MKVLILASSFLFILSAKSQELNFALKIRVTNLPPGKYRADIKIPVTPQRDTVLFTDSISAEKDSINVSGYLEAETLATLYVKKMGDFDFALGPGDSVSLILPAHRFYDSFSVSGSKRTISMVNYIYKVTRPQDADLRERRAKIDSSILNHLSENITNRYKQSYDSTYESYFHRNEEFADTVNSSTAIYIVLYPYFGESGKFNVYPNIEKAYLKFGNTNIIQAMRISYEAKLKGNTNTSFDVGSVIPLNKIFSNERLKKIEYILSKNKLVLLDFWASWCIPCRIEFPYLSESYKEFKLRKFDIVSISFDKKNQEWKRALNELSPLWKNNFIDTNAWNSKVVRILNIKSIPRNYLIDKKGKIYAKDIRGEDLKKTLMKLL